MTADPKDRKPDEGELTDEQTKKIAGGAGDPAQDEGETTDPVIPPERFLRNPEKS